MFYSVWNRTGVFLTRQEIWSWSQIQQSAQDHSIHANCTHGFTARSPVRSFSWPTCLSCRKENQHVAVEGCEQVVHLRGSIKHMNHQTRGLDVPAIRHGSMSGSVGLICSHHSWISPCKKVKMGVLSALKLVWGSFLTEVKNPGEIFFWPDM